MVNHSVLVCQKGQQTQTSFHISLYDTSGTWYYTLGLNNVNRTASKLHTNSPHKAGVLFTRKGTTFYRISHVFTTITEIIDRPDVRELDNVEVRVAPAFREWVSRH